VKYFPLLRYNSPLGTGRVAVAHTGVQDFGIVQGWSTGRDDTPVSISVPVWFLQSEKTAW